MFDPTSLLPARPSLEQLRKQAKELLRAYRAGDTAATERFRTRIPRLADPAPPDEMILADAQFVLAREYGFENWTELVHHVAAIQLAEDRLGQFEQLAKDFVAAYQGDTESLDRLNDIFPRSLTLDQLRELVHQRMGALSGETAEFALADAELFVARQHGFESWERLVESVAQPPSALPSTPLGLSSTPPFYRIDWEENTIEPRPPMSGKDWETIFDVMKELRITGLKANGQMTDEAVEGLARLDHVTHLELGGSKRLTDEGLRRLARMPQIEELDLSEYPGGRITDRGLETLRHLTNLKRFQMCWQSGVSDAGVANLAFCDHLESVNLMGTPTGDGAIKALAGKGLASVAGLEGLFGLSFFWHTSALTADGLKSLAGLPNLGFLGCQGELCNDEAMRHIAAIPRLCMLMGQGAVASDDGFAALSRSQTIEYIWGRECPNLGGRGFMALAAMPALRGLAVSCKNVDDAALSALPSFPALRALMPMDVPDEGFRYVGRCERLATRVMGRRAFFVKLPQLDLQWLPSPPDSNLAMEFGVMFAARKEKIEKRSLTL